MKSGMIAQDNFLLQAALEYAELGYPVFPCAPGDKVPLTDNGFLDATTDKYQIIKWWEQKSNANLGIATQGLLVVDVDGADNEWLTNREIMQSLSSGAMAKTPHGGRHFIFRQSTDTKLSNTTGKLALHVDTRADGGYIVAPPSMIGRKGYEWFPSYEMNSSVESLSVVPEWIVNKLSNEPKARVDLGCAGNPIPEGQRNNTLARISGNMRRMGLSESEIAPALLAVNQIRCKPPLPEPEVKKVAFSISRYEPDQISVAYIEDHFSQDRSKSYIPFPVEQLPDSIVDFVMTATESIGCDSAYIVLPLLAAIGATIGTTREVFLTNTWKVKPILWTAVIGESGTAKTPAFNLALQPILDRQAKAHQGNKDAIERYELENMAYEANLKQWQKKLKQSDYLPPDEPLKPEPPSRITFCVSDVTVEALAPLFAENPRGFLLHRDEIAGWIGDFDKYKSGGGSSDEQHFLSMYNASTIQVHRKGTQKDIFVPQAALSITGGIQPGILKRAMSEKQKQSGFLARFLLAYPERKVKQFPRSDISKSLIDDMKDLIVKLGSMQPVSVEGNEYVPELVLLSADAREAYKEFYEENARETVSLQNEYSAAWSKLEEIPIRLALIFHCVENATAFLEESEISLSTMQTAIKVTHWFKKEVLRVYALFRPTEEKSKRELTTEKRINWVKKHGGVVTFREVQQGNWDLKTAEATEQELKYLESEGYGQIMTKPHPKRGGHQIREFHLSTTSTIYIYTRH